MNLSHSHFPAKVKAARESKGISQAELARLAAISPQQVNRLEAGTEATDNGVTLRIFTGLANALGVSADSLLTK